MIFQDRTLKRIFLIVVILALLMPFASERLLFPAVRRLQVHNAERESVAVARHLAQTMGEEHEGEDEYSLLRDETEQLQKIFDLMAIKFFDAEGHVLFSSHKHRPATATVHPRVAQILSGDRPESHFVQQNETTYEGIRMNRDVVETYVPVVIRDEERGVMEIYYDIQARRADLEESLRRASQVSWGISGLVILAAAVILLRADGESRGRRQAESELKALNNTLEERVKERTAKLSEANTALMESRERFRKLTTCAVDAIIVADDTGRVTFWNESAERIFGFSREEMLGTELHSRLMPARYWDDFQAGFRQFRESGTGAFLDRTSEIIALRKDAVEIPVEISLTAVELEGKPHTIAIVRDISDRKKAQKALWESTARFQRLFQDSPEPALIVRRQTFDVLDVNDAALRLFHLRRDRALWTGIWNRFPAERLGAIRRAVGDLHTGRTAFRFDDMPLSIGDSEVVLIIHGHLISGENEIVYCGFTDVTERVRLAHDFEAALKRLVQGEKLAFLGTMVSGFAHDLNNPNQLVAVSLPVLERVWRDAAPLLEAEAGRRPELRLAGLAVDELKTQIPAVLADMRAGSRRISELIDGLLDFAREEQSDAETDFDINEVVEASLAVLKPKTRSLTQSLTTGLAPGLPRLRGRRQQIEQVVVNLVRNALEALPSPQNGVNVATRFEPDRRQVVISVRDEGIGMTPEVLEKATAAFFTTRRGHGGTGLGLALCHLFVEGHGGTLDLVSKPGEGTLAEVHLPAATPTDPA